MAQDQTDDDVLPAGRYTPDQASIEDVNAVVVDHDHLDMAIALLPDDVNLYTDDHHTRGRSEFNLIAEHEGEYGIATQVGTHIFGQGPTLDARMGETDNFADWLSRAQYDTEVSEAEE